MIPPNHPPYTSGTIVTTAPQYHAARLPRLTHIKPPTARGDFSVTTPALADATPPAGQTCTGRAAVVVAREADFPGVAACYCFTYLTLTP